MIDENTPAPPTTPAQDAQTVPPSGPEMTTEEVQAHKQSLISVLEEKLAAIPHEIVTDVKAVWAALKVHL